MTRIRRATLLVGLCVFVSSAHAEEAPWPSGSLRARVGQRMRAMTSRNQVLPVEGNNPPSTRLSLEQNWRRAVPATIHNTTQQLTAAVRTHVTSLLHNQTTVATDVSLALSLVALWQAFRTMMVGSRGLLRQIMSSFLAPPAKMAWQQIGAVVASVQQEPILRAWTQYSPHVVWQALRALGRLQDAVPNNTTLVVESSSSPLADDEVHVVGRDLAYYSVYATLAYGWFLALVQGQWRGGGSLRTVLQRTGLNETHILDAVWQAETHRPAYLLVRDPVKRSIVLTIRGTWSASDMLTDLCCSTTVLSAPTNTTTLWEWLRPAHRKTTLEAHAGMVQAALALRDSLQDKVAAALHAHPDHQLVLVGHSMGGGVAAILGLLWQNVFDGEAPPRVYLYGPPCVAAFESPLTQHANIHSVVLPGDPFCTLSLGHVTELAAAVDYLGRHDPLRRRLCRRPLSPAYAQEIWDLLAAHIEPRLSGNSTLYTKHVPPGRLWRLVPQRTHRWPRKRHWKLQGVATSDFLTLSLQPLALDLTQHVPALYEDCLQSIYNK